MNNRDIPVVILCGGMGTRLREETEYRPKPLVEIGGRPILWHIMKMYTEHGFRRFILCLGYKGFLIKQYFVNYRMMTEDFTLDLGSGSDPLFHGCAPSSQLENWSITFAETGAETMTGARVKRIERFIDTDHFMLTYGDGVSDVNIRLLFDFHREHGKLATVTAVHPVSRFGELVLDGDRVKQFSEKPQATDGFVNGGFFVFRRESLEYLREDESCILEREPLEHLAEDGELRTYRHTGFWHCMDTYRDVLLLNQMCAASNTPWLSCQKKNQPSSPARRTASAR